jgi:hypothetical protein
LSVKLDRWNLRAGQRLWDQIAAFIRDKDQSDGWAMFATPASLGSEPCREEFAYALDRALATRDSAFPIVGIFPGPVDSALIPSGIKARLYVSLTDPDWAERVLAACEGRAVAIRGAIVQPYAIRLHPYRDGKTAIEIRPRAGMWAPFAAGVPIGERDSLNPVILPGPAGFVPMAAMVHSLGEGVSMDGLWWVMTSQEGASPTVSYYLICDRRPTKVIFGVMNGLHYIVSLEE